jgi:hypothetical protein
MVRKLSALSKGFFVNFKPFSRTRIRIHVDVFDRALRMREKTGTQDFKFGFKFPV